MSTPHTFNPPWQRAYSRRAVLQLGGTGASSGEAVTKFTIVAENIKWDLKRVVVPAGAEVTATIENRDRGIPHNLHVKSPGDPKTELEDGPVTQTLRFTIEKPGSYGFVCDAHPTMTGTIEAV